MVLTDLIPKGGKNSQLNCMEIGGSSRLLVSYMVSDLCGNIYVPAEFSLPSSSAVRMSLVYCWFYFSLPFLLSPTWFPRVLFLVAGCRVWMNDSAGVLLLSILQGFFLKPFKARWQWADTADMWPRNSFPLLLHNTPWNIATNSYLLNSVSDTNINPVLVSESRSPERQRGWDASGDSRGKTNLHVGVMCMFNVQTPCQSPLTTQSNFQTDV